MKAIPTPVRIEPAFADREQIRALFERHAPYRALAAYAPEGIADEGHEGARRPVLPSFRGDWALGGEPLVEGADLILHNKQFVEAARALFGTSQVSPEFVAVNINGPMPACTTHVDNPSFHGATRIEYPLPFLRVMGFSRLFEAWRVVRASTISWFYDGPGGNFDYWPEGIEGPMWSEQPPFGNVALLGDMDRMYHRFGPIGDYGAGLPRLSAAAHIQPGGDGNWVIVEKGEVRATYPSHALRFSILWKAGVRDGYVRVENLTLDRIMEVFTADLRQRKVEFEVPADPLRDTAWILLLQRIYADSPPA